MSQKVSVHIMYRDREVISTEIKARPAPLQKILPLRPLLPNPERQVFLLKGHPWRRFNPMYLGMYLGKKNTALV